MSDKPNKVFWKSSTRDPDNIDLDELLNDNTEVALEESKTPGKKSASSTK